MALQAYKLDVLTHELSKASLDLSCRDFALEVVANLIRKVGEYVQQGKMTIAQEHTLSALTKFFIGRRISQSYRSENPSSQRIILNLVVVLSAPTSEDSYFSIPIGWCNRI
jgi:hypothetical protein